MKLTFQKEKETKGAVRYQEDAAEGQQVIGTLYVRKSALGDTIPESVSVDLDVGGGGRKRGK